MSFEDVLQRHCARAVPIILIDNAIDELSTVHQVLQAVRQDEDRGHDLLYLWSLSNGLQIAGATPSGKQAAAERYLQDAVKNERVGGFTTNPYSALIAIGLIVREMKQAGTGDRAGFVFFMGDRLLSPQDNDQCNQCIQTFMDIRDDLKTSQSCVYLIGIDFNIPKELKEHIVVLNAPLPSEDKYGEIVDECYSSYRTAFESRGTLENVDYHLEEEDRSQFVEALKGMSPFAAEQTVYLSTDMDGMSIGEMRQRAIQQINSTKGLSVYRGDNHGFAAIGGLDSIKAYANRLTDGKLKPKLLVYADEVEKMLGGSSGGDTSGISQNYLGTLLSEMQDTNALGMLLTGVYGAGKSEFAKRWGEEAGVLTIHLDMAGMKDSLVGNSEANLRRAMNVIKSIGGTDGGIIYMATCNRISQLPPEFKRRFNLGTFFFYFPDEAERAVIWDIYMKKYELKPPPLNTPAFDLNWTGAEIESCCRLAYLMQCDVVEAAGRIVPVATTAKEEIDRLVDEATGRFLSCSGPGVFTKPSAAAAYLAKDKPVKRTTSFN